MKYNQLRVVFHFITSCSLLSVLAASLLFPLSFAHSQNEAAIEVTYLQFKLGRIALTLRHRENSDIYLIDLKRQIASPLVATKAKESNPRWSHDGKSLAFDSDISGRQGIYVKSMVQPKKEPTKIALFKGAKQPDWSPDDAYLVFTIRNNKKEGRSLVVADAQGKNAQRLFSSRHSITTPRWSPRGTEILFASNGSWPGWDLSLLDINTKKTQTLTKGVQNFVRPTWHPDGGSILFSYGSARDFNLWKLDKGSREVQEVLSLPGRVFDAEWIMDGRFLLFVAEDSIGSGHYELFVYDTKTKTNNQLTRSKGSIREISWTSLPLPPVEPEIEKTELENQSTKNEQ